MSDAKEYEPPYLFPDYVSTRLRAPLQPLVKLPDGFLDFPAPRLPRPSADSALDLTRQHAGEPIGERIIVTGRVLDSDGQPVANTMVEIWQANAAGRYLDQEDKHPAPLDPNFSGAGRCQTSSSASGTGWPAPSSTWPSIRIASAFPGATICSPRSYGRPIPKNGPTVWDGVSGSPISPSRTASPPGLEVRCPIRNPAPIPVR